MTEILCTPRKLRHLFLEDNMMALYLNPNRVTRARWSERSGGIYIPVDVTANGDEYVVRALLPGLKAEDIQIEILEDVLTIQGEFATPERSENEQTLLSELPGGHFERSLRLPSELDAAQAVAEVKDGVLTLHVAKAERAKSKKISVSAK
jgi:HSP20 family protein